MKVATKLRADKEHVAYAASSAGGEHKQGAAVSYHQNGAPTLRPDASTALNSSDKGRLWLKATDNSLWIWDGTAWQHSTTTSLDAIANGLITKVKMATGFTAAIYPYARITDEKTDGSDGGTFTSGGWRVRVLNTIHTDNGSIVAVASNQITLDAGVYRVRASAPAQQVAAHQTRWRDVTNSNTISYGTVEQAPVGTAVQTRSFVESEFTVADDGTLFELQHICGTTKSGSGEGLSGSFSVAEIYSIVELWKLL